ncbi:cytochrome P460 family protein [Chitinophaga pinensis]|uniref:Cytochrome P460 n=1 Tax=Chitinophaga pinensis TaxID=79329 RepID=A0A5C6LV55_9BACT|nr:cytochrome P460 family protein [Chitinophaga pinensis]TWW00822.1 cytochrome P460 [Chitinophaga pinensis]
MRVSSKKWIVIGLFLVVVGIAIQFIRPGISNPPVTGEIKVPDDVAQILRASCYDCHSNQTQLKWFDQIAPASWLVAQHIRDGRKILNFSNWDSLAAGDQKGNLFLSVNQAMFGEMPLASYTTFHPEAKLTPAALNTLKTYVNSLAPVKVSDTSRFSVAGKQFAQWTAGTLPTVQQVSPVLNGIAYIQGYRNWQIVNISDRYDNGTMRVILGNDIAMKAIHEHKTNPWPDGTIFAKVAWEQLTDSSKIATSGELKQVEFMIRDEQKFASSAGWGWARWKGNDLKPYGKTLTFSQECVNCHHPMKNNDYVFTEPLTDDDRPEKITGQPQGQLITATIDKNKHTHSVLYGNSIAVQHARSGAAGPYPAGAVLTLATWSQQDDAHWFGAKVPEHLQSVEVVKIDADAAYEQYQSPGWKKTDATLRPDRIGYITQLKAAVIFN